MLESKPDGTENKKPPNAGKGRPKGVPNKATAAVKEALAQLAEGMTPKMQQWLEMTAYGVGTAWAEWTPPEGWDGKYPEGAKVLARGKLIMVPVLDDEGRPRTVNLSDVIAGTLPTGTAIDWIVRPDPGGSTDTMLRALEYQIPKLNRTELTDPDGKALVPAIINITGVKAPRRE